MDTVLQSVNEAVLAHPAILYPDAVVIMGVNSILFYVRNKLIILYSKSILFQETSLIPQWQKNFHEPAATETTRI